jgi:hypothetical protein
VFLWLVRNKKILTKDNLFKRHWQGNLDCIFCGLLESIDHLLFHCPVARFIWRIIQIAFNLSSTPKDTADLFGPWINSFHKTEKNLVLFGCGAVLWAIWRTRNDGCFNNKLIDDPSNVIFPVATGLMLGLFSRQRGEKNWWNKEAAEFER